MTIRIATLAAATLLAAYAPAPAAAQDAGCSYERCALITMPSGTMVQAAGDSARRRFFSWFFIPSIAPLEVARDPAHAEYRRSIDWYRASTPFNAIATIGTVGTILYVSADTGKRMWGRGAENRLLAVTVVSALVGQAISSRGAEHMSRAAWEYSRELSLPLGPRADGCTYARCALRFRSGLWSTHLVQGIDGEPITDVSAVLQRAGGDAATHYANYRQIEHGMRWVKRIVLGSLFGGTTLLLATNDKAAQGTALGMYVVGYAVGHMSLMEARLASDELQNAIWSYNSTLPRGR